MKNYRVNMLLGPLLALALAGSTAAAPAATTPTVAPKKISKQAVAVTPSATLSWPAPTARTDGSPITGSLNYNVYQGPTGAEVKQPALTTALTVEVVTPALASGTTVCWYVTAQESGGLESLPSNEVCKTFPAAAPLSPTLTVK